MLFENTKFRGGWKQRARADQENHSEAAVGFQAGDEVGFGHRRSGREWREVVRLHVS